MTAASNHSANDRYAKEQRFHDSLVSSGLDRPAGRFYAINRRSWDFYRDLIVDGAAQARTRGDGAILEYGSGAGAYSSLVLAEAGYPSVGIDLSAESVRAARERAEREYPGIGVDYRVMNAEALDFPENSFDLICGNGILHHLDLERSYEEIARTLRPDGSAIFSEPLGHNPLINLYRRLTPGQRTEDEHPLLMADLELARRYFGGVEAWYFHLLGLAATPFRSSRLFEPLLRVLDGIDRALLGAVAPLRRHAWLVVLRLTAPRDAAGTANPRPRAADKTPQ